MKLKTKYKYSIFLTEDGSHSICLIDKNESFHSRFGAVNESYFIFINTGLNYMIDRKKDVNILEVGFGTGLNALLTYKRAETSDVSIYYHAIEPYPLEYDIYSHLNYPAIVKNEKEIFLDLHQCVEKQKVDLSNNFSFMKSFNEIQKISLKENFYDLIYFDAFNPDLEPDIWSESVFEKIFKAMSQNSVLVTYSTKGIVRRAMKSAGFLVEKLPGPKGKREICRAYKE